MAVQPTNVTAGAVRDMNVVGPALVAKCGLDGQLERVEPLPRLGRNRHGGCHLAGWRHRCERSFGIREAIDFVPDLDNRRRLGVNAELGQHSQYVLGLGGVVRIGDVTCMQDDVGIDDLLQRGPKGSDQVVRQVCDEAYRIAEHDLTSMRQFELADRGVEGREQQVLGKDASAGQYIEKAGFPGIGVADQCHDRIRRLVALLPLLGAGLLDLFQAVFKQHDALGDLATVAFDLGFARTAHKAHATAAALPLKVGPGAHEPALLIVEMGKLDLQHAFTGGSTLAENFEDQRRAVQHLGAGLALEIALLDGRQRGIDEEQINLVLFDTLGQGFHIAATDKGSGPDLSDLDDFGENDVEPNSACKALELGLARLNAMQRHMAAHVGANQPRSRRLFLAVDELFAPTAGAAVLVVKVVHMARQSRSTFCSGSNSWIGAPGMMVEIACLYTSCDCASRRSSRQKLSNQVITPCSLTPLTRKIVTGTFCLRT